MKKLQTFKFRDFSINRNSIFQNLLFPENSGNPPKPLARHGLPDLIGATPSGHPLTSDPAQITSPPPRRRRSGLLLRRFKPETLDRRSPFGEKQTRRPVAIPATSGDKTTWVLLLSSDLSIYGGGSSNHGLQRSERSREVLDLKEVNAVLYSFR